MDDVRVENYTNVCEIVAIDDVDESGWPFFFLPRGAKDFLSNQKAFFKELFDFQMSKKGVYL